MLPSGCFCIMGPSWGGWSMTSHQRPDFGSWTLRTAAMTRLSAATSAGRCGWSAGNQSSTSTRAMQYQPSARPQASGLRPVCLSAHGIAFDSSHPCRRRPVSGSRMWRLEGGTIRGAEGLGHVGPAEPHLVGVDLLVPVAAAGGARLEGELVVEELGGLGVLVLLGDAVRS